MSSKKKVQNRQAGIRVVILLAVLICVNILAARFHTGIDLTSEKRFTLSRPTKNLLRGINGYVYVDVLLEGQNFPAGFQRLRESVRERLQSFRDVSGGKVVFHFRDPFAGKAEKEKGQVFAELDKKGVHGVNIRQSGDQKYTEQIVFPYAIIQYHGKEIPVRLLESHLGYTPLEILNYSESQLEYKLAAAINGLMRPDKPSIAYVMGNGEALGWGTWDALNTLQEIYHIDTIDLNSLTHISATYDAAIVCKPTQAFSEKDKFKLDQYVMNGGHLLMLLDGANAAMDSLREDQFLSTGINLNLDDMLFKWGVRVNPDLIEDLQSNRIFLNAGMAGDQPQMIKRNWYYLPVFTPTSQHPIVRNMDGVMSMYASTIDTVGNPDIHKTILLESSQYSRPVITPARISLSVLRYDPRPELYNKGFKPVAVLLEGRFSSIFQDRLPPDFLQILRDSLHQPYKPVADSAHGSMIIISDGDIFLNGVNSRTGPYEMGYWEVDNMRYANKAFILNCLEYLTDRSGLLEARNKDLRLRLLDGGRVEKERNKWRAINLAVPLAVVLIFASAYIFFRKRKYEKRAV
jgi:gliding-associated putative ABC transporter substrate-binding component GldG